MKIDRLVVRFKDKRLMKGRTEDFSFYRPSFTMQCLDGEKVTVNIHALKAAFIVKKFEGNKNYKYTYTDEIPYGGTKMKVEFNDGEVMIGYNPYDVYGNYGFFIHPADLSGNNSCVFVVTSAIRDFTLL